MADKFKYRFPISKQAAENTLDKQMMKCTEELGEAMQVRNKDPFNDEDIIEELLDTMYALEGCLRKFDQNMVSEKFSAVREKVKIREGM